MPVAPRLRRLDRRIRRSKRSGKLVFLSVLLVSVVFAVVLLQGLLLARANGRTDLVGRGLAGLGLLVVLNVFSLILTRRQHRLLDEAQEDLENLVRGDPPV